MILKRLTINCYRPFFEEQILEIEPDVTVLTGANDVGKSALLNILNKVAPSNDGSMASEADVNEDKVLQLGGPWHEVEDISAIATYQLGTESNQPELHGGELDTRWPTGLHEVNVTDIRDSSGNRVDVSSYVPEAYTRAIDLGISDRIKPVLEQGTILPIEHAFLEFAFESDDVWNELASLPTRVQNQRRDQANSKLKTGLASYKPESLQVELSLDFESRNPVKFVVQVQDRYGGFAGPHLRGAGYQKLLAFMFYLLTVQPSGDQYVILLLDEPENSLHANAQHSFRRVLESFAESPLIQVIYATHSPAMINPSRPETLRLLTRDQTESEIATTRIDNKPYIDGNFQSIRNQLGVLPADSLMFASIGIIAEGPTERLALNELIEKLIRQVDPQEYPNLKLLWRLTFVVSAGGTGEFRRWIEFAKAQNVSVIALLDGDSIKLKDELKQENSDIEVVCFDEGTEIEEVVEEDVYFRALEEVVPGNHKDMKKKYDAWISQSQDAKGKMFSKRVEMWLKKELGTGLDKPKVMAKAIKLAQMDQINWTKIKELIDAIRKAAENLP